MKEPIDLRQALHLCLKLENQNFRENHAFSNRNNTLQHRRAFQNTPPIPARRVEPKRFEGGRPPFCPQISHLPMVRTRMEVNRNFQQQNNNYGQKNDNYVPQRPTASKPQPRSGPMEVDQSFRSSAINYMNSVAYLPRTSINL